MKTNSFQFHFVKGMQVFIIILLFFTSINALIAGFLFIIDPSGNLMGMTTDYLKTSPFTSFLIPGIVLFTVNGVLNLIAAISVIKKWNYSAYLTILQGIVLIGWIIIQVLLVNDINVLHITMFTIGALFVLGGWIMKRAE